MTDPDATESPLAAAAGAAGPHTTDAFALLGNETRLAILLALWEAYDPKAEHNVMSFSDLRDQVGVRQGAQFNYHLDKVVGRFVRKTEVGYELKRAGLILVQSIIAGIGTEDPTLERTEIDDTCEFCGASVEVTYANRYVYRVCSECEGTAEPDGPHPEGMLSGWTLEPTGVTDRSAEEAYVASTIRTYGWIAMRFEGLCPLCSSRVEWSIEACEDHDATDGNCPNCGRKRSVVAHETCTTCKSSGVGTPGIKLLFHPAVVAFCYDHGIEVGFTGTTDFEDVARTMDLVEEFEETVVSTDPLRIRVTIALDADELHLTLDGNMNVLDVEEVNRPAGSG